MERDIRNMAEDSSTRTTRLTGELDDRYEEYRDERDMTDAEAIRALLRSGLDEQAPKPSGLTEKLFGAPQGQLLQLKLLGWFSIYAAVALGAYEFGVAGGLLWLLPAGLFVVLMASTAVGILAGVWSAIDPTNRLSAADDEVKA